MIKFFTKKDHSPFAKDISFLFLPLMMMFMVFMATLSLGAVIAINVMTNHWHQNLSGSLTIQILPLAENFNQDLELKTKVETAVILLQEMENVIEAIPLNNNELKNLLRPWFGSTDLLEDLPLPQLINVKIKNNNPQTIQEIETILKKHLPSASFDNHLIWAARLAKLIASLKLLSLIALCLIVSATMFTVIYATRTSLAVHKAVINLLHLIGAKDSYVAMQYAKRTFFLAVVGGFLGFILATPALLFIGSLASNLGGGVLSYLDLGRNEWLIMFLIPLATALVSTLTAYFTVQRDLLRML